MSKRSARPRRARSEVKRFETACVEASAPVRSRFPIIQKLSPDDRDRLEKHLLRLGPTDRQMRFCGSVDDHSIRAYCDRINWSRTTILGCFLDHELCAVSELVRTKTMPVEAEVALTVEKPFQNQGIGTELLRRTLIIARNRYISKVYMVCLLENDKMRHIARKFDADLVIHEGEVEGKIWPPYPTFLSMIEEAVSDSRAIFRATFEPTAPVLDDG